MNRGSSTSGEEEVPPYDPKPEETKVNNGFDKEETQGSSSGFIFNGIRKAGHSCRPRNIILFGETGVGKSSVINLLSGAEVAATSPNLDGCTLDATEYMFTFPGPIAVSIFDTVGLEEPEIGVNTFFGAIQKAHELLGSLSKTGGVDLLVFCIRGGRITAATQRNYRLFYEVLCESQVPLAIVVTNLEHEDVMEEWWERNKGSFKTYNINPVAHACITALPDSEQTRIHAQKRTASQESLRKMLLSALGGAGPPHVRETQSWLIAIVSQLRSWLTENVRIMKKKVLLQKLKAECKFTHDQAEKLAHLILTARRG